MTNEELLAQDDMLWTTEGRKRILVLMEKAREQERSKRVMLCGCGKVLENPAAYAAHCREAPDHFTQT